MNILIIGEKPAKSKPHKKPTSLESSSNKILHEWILYMKPHGEVHMINFSDDPNAVYLDDISLDDFGPRLLDKMLELDERNIKYRIITLGDIPHSALHHMRIDHYPLPKPNKKLDKKYLSTILNECYAYIHEDEKYYESQIVQIINGRLSKLV